jgi:hypothetical protein
MRRSLALPPLVPPLARVSLLSYLLVATVPATAGVLQSTPWSPLGAQAGAGFGQSSAPAGDVDGDGYGDLLVGAPLHDGPGGTDAGAAFLYRGSATGLAAAPAWTFHGPQAGGQTGSVVTPAGDVNNDGFADVVVTSPLFDTSGPTIVDAGRFDLFFGSAIGLPASPSQTIPGQQAGGRVGFAAAPAGDVNGDGFADVIVGMPNVFSFSVNDGAARIYPGHATGLLSSSFSPIGGAANELFGFAVAGVGDVDGDGYDDVAVGAPGTTTFFASDGSVYLYRGGAGGPTNVAFATLHGFSDSCRFGAAVAPAGDVNADGYADVAIGAPGAAGPGGEPGWATIMRGSPAGFGIAHWSAFGDADGERFGIAIAPAGDVNGDDRGDVVVGGDRSPTPAQRRGRALVVLGAENGVFIDTALQGAVDGEALGIAVATAGDVDGDGFSDLAVGAPGAAGAVAGGGRVAVFRGSASKPVLAAGWPQGESETLATLGLAVAAGIDARRVGVDDLFVAAPFKNAGFPDAGEIRVAESSWPQPTLAAGAVATGTQASAILGNEVARAGDVNGDGHEDLLTGSRRYSTGTPNEGIAQLFYGGASGLDPFPSWSFEGPTQSFNAGHDVDAGDFNGDGLGDLLVASWTGTKTGNNGSARVFLGTPSGPEAVASWVTPPVSVGGDTWYGFRVAVGDWDGDGYDDAAVSAPEFSNPQPGEGRVEVFFGGPGGLAATPAWKLERDVPQGTFGYDVANAGDVNGDGVSDLLVGSPGDAGGRAYLYPGSLARDVPEPRDSRALLPDAFAGSFGRSVQGIGDVDKDGFGDVLVGAFQSFNGQVNEGAVYLYRGSELGGHPLHWWKFESNVTEAFFGYALARAGDVNQDGWPDFAVGAPYDAPGGKVYLFLGGGGGPLHATVQTVPAPGVPPLPMGARVPGNAIGPLASFRSAAGRTRGRVEVQLGTQNEAWSGGLRTLHGPVDSGAPGLYGSTFPVFANRPGLTPALAWRWRERSVTRSPFFPHSPWRQPRSFETAQPHFRTGGTNVAVEPPRGAGSEAIALLGVTPQPSRGETRLRFRLARPSAVHLELHDVRGRTVRQIELGERPAGEQAFAFDGRDAAGVALAPGIYLVTLEAGGRRDTAKLARLP